MDRIVNESRRYDALVSLKDAYHQQFLDYLTEDDRFVELLTLIAGEFVEEYIPIVGDDDADELALELIGDVTL